ncbi:MAG TPA: TetR/AcrR family transcriptional regulator [Candidatus Angelobacter sp.]|nr:TetR/AcrR family transcriptional regulator [Candidatus Angelobacter sp.]
MPAALKSGKSGSRGEPEKTRAAILKAALEEFSHEGVAGARTDEIARRAGVNKALLYYYFKDKDGLYTAALEQVFSGLHEKVGAVLERTDLPPRERLVLYAQTHFDYIASAPVYPRLVQREFMRSTGRMLSPEASRIMERHLRPFYDRLEKLILEGARSGDFRNLDPMQTVTSMLGIIVFYFISLPAQMFMHPGDPSSPERIAARRAAMLDFICAAVLTPEAAKKVCQP